MFMRLWNNGDLLPIASGAYIATSLLGKKWNYLVNLNMYMP